MEEQLNTLCESDPVNMPILQSVAVLGIKFLVGNEKNRKLVVGCKVKKEKRNE